MVNLGTYLLQLIRLWGRMTCFGQADVDWMIGQGEGWTLQLTVLESNVHDELAGTSFTAHLILTLTTNPGGDIFNSICVQ